VQHQGTKIRFGISLAQQQQTTFSLAFALLACLSLSVSCLFLPSGLPSFQFPTLLVSRTSSNLARRHRASTDASKRKASSGQRVRNELDSLSTVTVVFSVVGHGFLTSTETKGRGKGEGGKGRVWSWPRGGGSSRFWAEVG
jgi:hypothetical protein